MSAKHEIQLEKALRIIEAHKLNKTHIASTIGMNRTTFVMKSSPDYPNRNFSVDEINRLIDYLDRLASDLETLKVY